MSDRYVWHDQRGEFEPEPDLDIRAAFNASPDTELEDILRKHAVDAAREAERIAGWESVPLQLTSVQRERLWLILKDEVGPISASKILARIEREA